MIPAENAASARLRLKAKSKERLDKKGVCLALIFGICIVVTAKFAVETAEAAAYYVLVALDGKLGLSPSFAGIITAVFDIISYLVMAPFVLGLYRVAAGAVHTGRADMRDILHFLHPQKYFRALVAYTLTLAPIHVYLLLCSAVMKMIPVFFDAMKGSTVAAYMTWVTQLASGALLAGLGVLLFWLYCRFYSVIAAVVCGDGRPLLDCIADSFEATRGNAGKIFVFRLSFIPAILLGCVSVGIILLIFTLPYMLISYFYYNAELFGVDADGGRMTEVTFDER